MKKKVWVCALVLALCLYAVSAAAKSYSYGDRSAEVTSIQQALTALDLYYADVTGHYGEKTVRAVKLFQKRQGLVQTGVADDTTRTRLYLLADAKRMERPAQTDTQTQVSTNGVLRNGARGDAVIRLQEGLRSLGYYTGTVSGHYGSLTQEAVRRFQKHVGLNADGVAGQNTLNRLNALLTGNSVYPTATPAPGDDSLLKLGMSSNAVRTLQQNLTALGYYEGTVTGNYGKLTKEAVRLFQKDHDLTADGVAGTRTLTKISAEISAKQATPVPTINPVTGTTPAPTIAPISTAVPTANPAISALEKLDEEWTLRLTSRSGHVTRLQAALKAMGYFTGTATGYYGEKTETAVIAYQKARGLTADGIAGRATLSAINKDIERGSAGVGTVD